MKRETLCLIGLGLALLTGCSHDPAPTNGGLSAAAPAQTGQQSANGKAETGALMRMDQSNVPPMIAKKIFRK
jgi:hypothetical protein